MPVPIPTSGTSAVASLIDKIVSWFIDPQGFEKLTREHQIEEITTALAQALDARAFDAADLLYQRLRKLCTEAGS